MSNKLKQAGILGIGSCLPEKVLTNFELEKMVDTSDEWIVKRTGISERRVLYSDQQIFTIGVDASQKALENAGIPADQIDCIIVTTSTPDYLTPATSCIIQREIGAMNAAAFDLNAACSGFIYGLTLASQFIATGYYKHILLVSCEGLTKVVDWEERNTCVLFGDGAGAVVLGPVEDGYGILTTHLGTDGNLGHNITIPCCSINEDDLTKRLHDNKRVLWMDGSEVFKFAVRVMSDASEKVINDAGLSLDDIKLIVPHQANIRIIDGAARRLGVPSEKIYTNIQRYGNISSASVPVALDEAVKGGIIGKDDYIVVVGFGGGLTWGSALIKWR